MARELIGNIKGPQGEQGPQGPQGPEGPPGKLSDFMVSIDDYGATGDGVTDDSDAFNAMLNSEHTSFYIPNRNYLFKSELTVNRNNIKLLSDGTLLFDVVDGTCLNIAGDDNVISVNVDGQSLSRIGINVDGRNNIIEKSTVKNIYSETDGAFGINSTQNGDTIIRNNTVDTVTSVGDSTGGNNNGTSRAIRITGLSTNDGFTIIEKNNIRNVLGEEGDAIHLNAPGDDVMEVIVRNNHIYNYSRRAIKIQCSKTKILNNTIENYDEHPGLIRCIDLQYIDDTVVDGNTLIVSHIGAFGLNGYDTKDMVNTTITNNTITLLSDQPAIYTSYVDGVIFSGNTITGGSGIICPRSKNMMVKDNILKDLLTTTDDYPMSFINECENISIIGNTIKNSQIKRSLRTTSINVEIIGNNFNNENGVMEVTGGNGVVANNIVKGYTVISTETPDHTLHSNVNIPSA